MSQKSKKIRLDRALVEQDLVETRAKAQAVILAGQVFVGQQRLDKPGIMISVGTEITLKNTLPYVSRGGVKLLAALEEFKVTVDNVVCLDIGASTGGFTDCLLQRGAQKVVALDVGHGQFAWKLRQDPRVESREHVNARFLQPDDFKEKFDLVVCDVSFISLKLILPVIPRLLKEQGKVITLIKPQFEVGREEVGKGGIVRDEAAQKRVTEEIKACAVNLGFIASGVIESPILGQEGNREFLACFSFPEKKIADSK